MACAFVIFGICFGFRRMTVPGTSSTAGMDRVLIAPLDFILAVFGFGIVGILVGLVVTAVQRGVEALDRAEEWRDRQAERWDRLARDLEAIVSSTRAESIRPATANGDDPTRRDAVDAIRRAILNKDWREADRLMGPLRADEGPDPELDRLGREIEHGRGQEVETRLERIRASREVGDAEGVLELYQEAAPLLDPPIRKSLDDDLARWFMSQIQRRLRSGTIQPEVVTLSARVSELFGGTAEGASLRAGLPTLRRTVGLCPRCGGPYIGVSDACPVCLDLAPS
jgi:hypothetical protein